LDAKLLVLCLLVAGYLEGDAAVGQQERVHRDPLRYVDPNIGGISRLLQAVPPFIQRPHGMVRALPLITPGLTDRYLSTEFYGLAMGPIAVMPSAAGAVIGTRGTHSELDHAHELLRPDYYSLDSADAGVRSELTVSSKTAAMRFHFSKDTEKRVFILLPASGQISAADQLGFDLAVPLGGNAHEESSNTQKPTAYLRLRFEQPLAHASDEKLNCRRAVTALAPKPDSMDRVCTLDFRGTPNRAVELRIGLSYISGEQARRNLKEEMEGRSFGQLCRESAEAWHKALSSIRIEGGTESQWRVFYTALYRSMMRLTDVTEDDRYYSGFDEQVHVAEGRHFYVGDGLWDTYRSMHPLQMLIEPKVEDDVLNSYVRMYQQSGWMPSFPSITGEGPAMVGQHAAALIADGYAKGLGGFDLEAAYEGLKKNALEGTMLPWRRGPATALDQFYREHGYFAALNPGEPETVPEVHPYERRQATSVTLGASYDAWCIALLAEALGHSDDAAEFRASSLNYRKLFDQRIGFISARTADGEWVIGFDPKATGGQGGRDYFTEVNAWIATFDVQHDIGGLIGLMGGRKAFAKKLDDLFETVPDTSKRIFLNQFPDMTGLVGMYAQGNEPAFHIPYLYVFAGEPWKTQFRIRQLLDTQFSDSPDGLPGDEDGGAESSWYVFSALGFYPVCPGSPIYEIGTPLFPRSEIALGAGRVFTVVASGVSSSNKYIGSATLNGKPLQRAWFTHQEVEKGGTLVLRMQSVPNRNWGSGAQDLPPSGLREASSERTPARTDKR